MKMEHNNVYGCVKCNVYFKNTQWNGCYCPLCGNEIYTFSKMKWDSE